MAWMMQLMMKLLASPDHAPAKQEDLDALLCQETATAISECGLQPANLVRSAFSHHRITAPVHCGDGVDVLALELQVGSVSLLVYNIYRSQVSLMARESKWLEWCASFNHQLSLGPAVEKSENRRRHCPALPSHPPSPMAGGREARHYLHHA